jgi:hypothetical protein
MQLIPQLNGFGNAFGKTVFIEIRVSNGAEQPVENKFVSPRRVQVLGAQLFVRRNLLF